jgi:hypothetical protein
LHLGVATDADYDPELGYRMQVRITHSLAAQLAALPGLSGQIVRRELLAEPESLH